MSQSIAQLLSAANISFTDECAADLHIEDIASDSRAVIDGGMFCAWPGLSVDGRDYIDQAVANGAAVILCEAEGFTKADSAPIPIILVPGLQYKVGLLADAFFEHPSADMQVFGVTGTNGKTTCCYLLAQAIASMGASTAIMGTLGYGAIDNLKPASHTTPDAISVHRRLAELRDQGVTQVCMEVSSHALDQGRVAGVVFYATLFTNLSHDHLDYHGDMTTYGLAKQQLFTAFQSDLAIINADDVLGVDLCELANAEFIVSYGVGGDVVAEDVTPSASGLAFHVEAGEVDFALESQLIGLVNVPNILLLVCALLALSTPVDEIKKIVAGLTPAPGRMELLTAHGRPNVVIDYAHTPDALEKALQSVQQHCEGDLWCVFGCGGDRDKDKRPVMGQIAAQNANRLLVTNDNPRSESPEQIAADILAGIDVDAEVILDRAAAIAKAITSAANNDWILIAGKGHEATQTIGADVLPFSDQEQVLAALEVAA